MAAKRDKRQFTINLTPGPSLGIGFSLSALTLQLLGSLFGLPVSEVLTGAFVSVFVASLGAAATLTKRED